MRRMDHQHGASDATCRSWRLPDANAGNCRGLTLTELLCVSLILMLVGGVALVLAQTGGQIWLRTDAQLTSLTQVQRAINLLSKDLREARRAGLTCGPGSTVVLTPVIGTGPITYQFSGGQLTKQVGTNAPQVMVSGLTAFTPTCASGGSVVQLRLTAQVNAWSGPSTLSSQVWVQSP